MDKIVDALNRSLPAFKLIAGMTRNKLDDLVAAVMEAIKNDPEALRIISELRAVKDVVAQA